MKRLLSLLLTLSMLVSLVPVSFAADGDIIKFSFVSTAIDGTGSVVVTKATYENTKANGSAPWAYVNLVQPNNNTAYATDLHYNWYNAAPFKAPEHGDRGIVLKIKVETGGDYSVVLNHLATVKGVNAKVFLIPVSEGSDFSITGTGAETLKTNIKNIPEKYYIGYADGYSATQVVRNTSLKYMHIDVGEYYLVVSPHGVSDKYNPDNAKVGSSYLFECYIQSLVLDPEYKPTVEVSAGCGAINLGESIQADISVTYGGVETSDVPDIVSHNPEVAELDESGIITAKSVGVASFTITVGQAVKSFSVAVVDPDKKVYEYVMGGGALNNLPDTVKNGDPVEQYPKELYNVNPEYSMPWKLGVMKRQNNYRLYYDTSNFGSAQSSVTADNIGNAFFSYSVYIPKGGLYGLEIDKWAMTDGGKAKIYLAPYAPVSTSAVIPSENGPVTDAHFVGELDFSGSKNNVVTTEPVGVITVPAAGEYLFVIVPSDAKGNRAPRYNYKGFRLDSENALRTLELDGYKTELNYLEESKINVTAKRLDGYVFTENEIKVTFASSNEKAVFVNDKGELRAIGDGTSVITVSATDGVKTIKKEIEITATDNTDTTGYEIDVDDSLYVREKAIIELYVLKESGNKIPVPFENITYTGTDGIVEISDGMISALSEGEITLSASAFFRGEAVSAEKKIEVILHDGKTEPTLYTYEKRQNAAENVKKYDWAETEMKKYTMAADKIVDNLDVYYNNIAGEGVPRGRQVGAPNDPDYNRCRYCGVNNIEKHGGTGWDKDYVNRLWKVQCPDCKRLFPSNDFESFYELGRDKQGYFDVNRARQAHHEKFVCEYVKNGEECVCIAPAGEYTDEWYEFYGYGLAGGYLYNDLYSELRDPKKPETCNKDPYRKDEDGNYYEVDGTRWGVDDGFGYVPGRTYTVGESKVEERHGYIAMYHSDMWSGIYTYIRNLSLAYVYSGDIKYGRAGAILLDRLADVWPTFTLKQYEKLFFNTHGGSGYGAVQGRINDCDIARYLALGTDAFYPALTDDAVIRYLSEKAEIFGLENEKKSSQDIWENWEERLLKTIFEMEKDGRIHGNFGQKQYALAAAAVSLDREPETSEMLDWIYKSGSISNAGAEGGNLASQLIDEIDRDGFGNEAAPNYNFTWITNMMGMADAMAMYKGEKDYSPYSHPKFAKMYDAVTRVVLTESHHAQIGDSGGVASLDYKATDDVMLTGLLNLVNTPYAKPIAQYLYIKNGYSADGLHYGIMDKDPESAEQDILELIDGTPKTKSEMLTGYGFAILRDGQNHKSANEQTANNNLRDFWISFGRTDAAHSHNDALNLGMEAYGLNLAPDLGYPENTGMDPQRMQWINQSLSHNTVTVDESGQEDVLHGFPLHYDITDEVKVMDIDAQKANPQTENFRRTVVMVNVDDDVSYGVDFFRVTGGNVHTYSFHSQAENAYAVEGLAMVQDEIVQDENGNDIIGSYAGADVPYGKDPDTQPEWSYVTRYPRGYTWLRNVRRDAEPESESFAVEFDVQDYRKAVKNGNDITLRMTQMNNFIPDEVAIAAGAVPRKNENKVMPETLDYVLVQRRDENEELDSLFTTVFEPYRGERYLSSITQVQVSGNVPEGEAVCAIKTVYADRDRADYIIYATNNSETYTVSDKGEEIFSFRGFVGVYSINSKGAVLYSYVHDGDIIGEETADEKAYSGTVHSFQKELSSNNFIDVDMKCDDIASLAGKYIFIENDGVQNAVYKIETATDNVEEAAGLEEGKIRLDIGTVTLIRGHKDIKDANSGYIYNIKEKQNFCIPLSHVSDDAPVFVSAEDKISTSAGSSVNVPISAESPITDNAPKITYVGTTLPRGASVNAETGVFTWKPDASQVGDNHVAITARDSDGRESTLHFTVTVYGSTTGKPDNDNTDVPSTDSSESSAGGGGGGGAAPDSTQNDTGNGASGENEENNEDSGNTDNTGTENGTLRFTDLESHTWAKEAINSLAADGIIRGTSETTFSPANNITRADFALLLVRAFKLESDSTENFADVSADDYFAHELAIARNTGLVNGIGDNKFDPRNHITRQDMMVIVHRALQSQSLLLEEKGDRRMTVDEVLSQYPDYSTVAPYARDAVTALIGAGIVDGKNSKIAPNEYTTRAEVAVLIKRVLDYTK